MSNVITVVKKIGEKVLSIVEYPVKHSIMLAEMLHDYVEDEPKVKTAVVGLVQQFEALGPDVLKALAEKGLDIPEDVKAATDIQSLFTFFTGTFLPAVEDAYGDFKKDSQIAGDSESSNTAAVASVTASTPGLHNVVPA